MIRARENKQWKDPLEADDLLLAVGATQLERSLSTVGMEEVGRIQYLAFQLQNFVWGRVLGLTDTSLLCVVCFMDK